MQTTPKTFSLTETGCHIDSHQGHYAIPSVIELAVELGYLLDPFERYVLDHYQEHSHEDAYPQEAVIELSDDAIDWLNSIDRPSGQNSPPTIPDGYAWGWNDGDFGLYSFTDDEDCTEHGFDECPDCGNAGVAIGSAGYVDCHRFWTCQNDRGTIEP